MAHVGEEAGFCRVGFLGAVFLLGVFLREVGKLGGLLLQRRLRGLQVLDAGAQLAVVLDQLLLVVLDLGDVGADRDETAVLGPALADVKPASIVELSLERLCAVFLRRAVGDAFANLRHAADLDDGFVGRAGRDRQSGSLCRRWK